MSSSQTPVVNKFTTLDTQHRLVVTQKLMPGETVVSALILAVQPTSTPPLTLTVSSVESDAVIFSIAAGAQDVSYIASIKIVTSTARYWLEEFTVLVEQHASVPYQVQDPAAFRDLLGSIDPGESVNAAAHFIISDTSIDSGTLSHGAVSWDVLDNRGMLISSGASYDYEVIEDSFMRTVRGASVVHIPSGVPPTSPDTSYQIRWTLSLPGQVDQYLYESLEVLSSSTAPLGSVDSVEMYGDIVTLFFTSPKLYDTVNVEIYRDNLQLLSLAVTQAPTRSMSGYTYSVAVESSAIGPASLDPYAVSWKYSNSKAPNLVYRETAKLFLVNASIAIAVEDAKARVAKARVTLLGTDDTLFDTATIMTWLRRGADDFNAHTLFTNFTMSNATGAIRSAWLTFSEIAMLRAQALLEGEKSFDFSGQAISLNVDRTQHYSGLADALQGQVDNVVPALKKNLAMRGLVAGDGNVTGGSNRARVGISLSQASPFPRVGWSR